MGYLDFKNKMTGKIKGKTKVRNGEYCEDCGTKLNKDKLCPKCDIIQETESIPIKETESIPIKESKIISAKEVKNTTAKEKKIELKKDILTGKIKDEKQFSSKKPKSKFNIIDYCKTITPKTWVFLIISFLLPFIINNSGASTYKELEALDSDNKKLLKQIEHKSSNIDEYNKAMQNWKEDIDDMQKEKPELQKVIDENKSLLD